MKKKTKSISKDYITIKGNKYEKLSVNSIEVALDLEEHVLRKIDRRIDEGEYVSRGDAIRDILRKAIAEKITKNK